MSCDLFTYASAKRLLSGKCIYFFGDSNIRSLYKDLLWMLESGTLVPESALKTKNEQSFANDRRVSNGKLHGGRNYIENREYKENPYVRFQFITRLFMQEFIDAIVNAKHKPDYVIIHSCMWDMTRWGVNGVEQFKSNLYKTFDCLKTQLPNARIIWLTGFPPSFQSKGGFLRKEVDFLRNMLPWHMVFANQYATNLAKQFQIDVLDIHYYLRFLQDYHADDGIHWAPVALRLVTNMLLTHITLVGNFRLPGNMVVTEEFMSRSQVVIPENPQSSTNQTNAAIQTAQQTSIAKKRKRNRNQLQAQNKRNSHLRGGSTYHHTFTFHPHSGVSYDFTINPHH